MASYIHTESAALCSPCFECSNLEPFCDDCGGMRRYGYKALDSPAQRAAGVPEEQSGVVHPALTGLAGSLLHAQPKPLYFATDEDGPGNADPYVATYDQSAEPIEYFADTLELVPSCEE